MNALLPMTVPAKLIHSRQKRDLILHQNMAACSARYALRLANSVACIVGSWGHGGSISSKLKVH
jgi:hypothetical protein